MTRRTIFISFTSAFIIFFLALCVLWYVAQSRYHSAEAVQFVANQAFGNDAGSAGAVIPALLGMEKPRTILLLFLNNTEIRPGGGFIGSFGVATIDHGAVTALYTDGTENLDRAAIVDAPIEPPEPIRKHLIARWFFRDANWSPDFVESSKNVLKFYEAERGPQAAQIETVVGVTPEVLEMLIKYTGPVVARGKTYTAENVTDLLEHSVEVAFHEEGIPTHERKVIIGEIAAEIVSRTKHISPLKWPSVLADVQSLIEERHIIVYDRDPEVQKNLDSLGWSGRLKTASLDSLMFVDANLASLKTDRVMDRQVRYDIFRDAASGQWRGRVTMRYKNNGSFDWRTTRYGTYTRWYFPAGTQFLNGSGSVKSHKERTVPGTWDVNEEQGRVSVGSFIITEPGKTTDVVIDVALAPEIVAAIAAHRYELLVQKQLGTDGFELTVHADFGTSLTGATPSELSNKFGDTVYDWTGRLKKDAVFTISL